MALRDLESEFLADIMSGRWRPAIFAEIELKSSTLRIWSGDGDKTWSSETWIGAGELVSMSQVKEVGEVRADGISFGLKATPELRAAAYDELRHRKLATVWIGSLAADASVRADPYMAFRGYVDAANLGGDTTRPIIRVTVESEYIDLFRARERLMTDQDHQLDFPGDMFFEFKEKIQEEAPEWGD